MRTSIRLAAAIVLTGVFAPMIANADDIVTLSYESALLTGSYSNLPTGLVDPAPLPVLPFSGIVTGTVQFDETALALHGAVDPLYSEFELVGNGGVDIGFGSTAPILLTYGTFGSCANSSNFICLTSDNGVITGATVGLINDTYHSPPTQLSIGPQGDMASYLYATTQGTCENMAYGAGPGTPYTGNPISPCSVEATSSMAGTWTVSALNAPEIDPGMAGSGLTLLAGCLAIVRGRKRVIAWQPRLLHGIPGRQPAPPSAGRSARPK